MVRICSLALTRRCPLARPLHFAALLGALLVLTTGSPAFAAPSRSHIPASGSGNLSLYVHVATTANTSGSVTEMHHDEISPFETPLSHDPNAMLLVTATLTPNGGGSAPLDAHPVGVWFDTTTQDWTIFNEDGAAMPIGAAFNVQAWGQGNVIDPPGISFIQHATTANIVGDYTDISNPLIDGQPTLVLVVTANLSAGFTFDSHPLGVWYHSGHWSILHEDGSAIPVGAAYNVLATASQGFRHAATAANSGSTYTILNQVGVNANPAILLNVTPYHTTRCVFLPPAVCFPGGPFYASPLAVLYNPFNQRWFLVNQAGTAIAPGTLFNVNLV